MKKVYLVILFFLGSFMLASAWPCAAPANFHMYRNSAHPILKTFTTTEYLVQASLEEEEDLPFDSSIGNWIAKLLLWFVYLSLGLLIFSGTFWSLTASSFWSWVVCLLLAFFYAMLLGRYWGYGVCLVGFVVLFSVLKLFLTRTQKGREWNARYLESGDSQLLKKMRKNREKKN